MQIEREQSKPRFNPVIDNFIDLSETTPHFQSIFEEATQLFPLADSRKLKTYLREHFAGAVFEAISLEYLRSLFSSKRMLGPEDTLSLYEVIYPDAKVSIKPFGLTTLHNLTVPDALILRPQRDGFKVAYVCETTLSNRRVGNKAKAVRMVRRLQYEAFEDAKLLFVTPSNVSVHLGENPRVRQDRLPISTFEFGTYLNSLLQTIDGFSY